MLQRRGRTNTPSHHAGLETAEGSAELADDGSLTDDSTASPATIVSAALAGFLLPSAVNAVFIEFTPWPAGGATVRAWHHFYDVGISLAAGLLVATLVLLWRFFNRRRGALLVMAILVAGLGAATLPENLLGLASRLSRRGAVIVVWPLSIVASQAVTLGFWLATRLRPTRLHGLALLAAVGLAVVNNLLLPGDYVAIHLIVALTAAVMAGAWFHRSAFIRRVSAALHTRIRKGVALATVLAIALVATLRAPSSRVTVALMATDAQPLAQYLHRGRARVELAVLDIAISRSDNPWFDSRTNLADVAPSKPALLPADGIVLLVTIDSVREDSFSDPRHAKFLPKMSRLASESVYFSQMRSVGSGTVITFSSVFTGKHSFQLLWENRPRTPLMLADRSLIHNDDSVRFTELLSRAGIRTVTFATFPPLHPEAGIMRGFDEATFITPQRKGQQFALAKETLGAAIDRLNQHKSGPLFMFVHLLDPHYPYDAAGKKRSPRWSQSAELRLVDREIAKLIQALKDNGLWSRTALILGADHGEGFGQHKGVRFHNNGLYDEVTRVPMFFHIPGTKAAKVDQLVSSIDLGPTILDLYGLPTPGSYMGQSLLPLIRGENVQLRRPIISSTLPQIRKTAYHKPPYKLILSRRTRTIEIYDLSKDPLEQNNIADEVDQQLYAELHALIKTHEVKPKPKPKPKP